MKWSRTFLWDSYSFCCPEKMVTRGAEGGGSNGSRLMESCEQRCVGRGGWLDCTHSTLQSNWNCRGRLGPQPKRLWRDSTIWYLVWEPLKILELASDLQRSEQVCRIHLPTYFHQLSFSSLVFTCVKASSFPPCPPNSQAYTHTTWAF